MNFPLYANTMAAGQADLTMHVTRNTAGTIVNINAAPNQDPGDRRITGYLLDLSELFTWQGSGQPLRLTQLTGLSQIIQSLQRRQWAELGNGAVETGGKELTVDYATSSRLPVSSAQMTFQDKNSLARIVLESRANAKDPWRTRCAQVFYTLSLAASEVRNEPCTFTPTSDRFEKWLLWAILILGVGLLAGMARSLIKEMNKRKENRTTEER